MRRINFIVGFSALLFGLSPPPILRFAFRMAVVAPAGGYISAVRTLMATLTTTRSTAMARILTAS